MQKISKTSVLLMALIPILLLALLMAFRHADTRGSEEGSNEEAFAMIADLEDSLVSATNAVSVCPNMRIDTTENLLVYYPEFSRIDLVCGTMPSIEDDDVIFCAEAAFTAQYLDTFSHKNICGPHVSAGVLYDGCGQGAAGVMTWAKGGWKFSVSDKANLLKKAAAEDGMGFVQYMVIFDGQVKSKPFKDTSVNEYRCLCEKNGKLCIADSRASQSFGVFRDALLAYGVKYALYLDMGPGWNYSWWRDSLGVDNEIHKTKIPYTTNWITFYK